VSRAAPASCVLFCLALAACAAQQASAPPPGGEVLFDGTLQELLPHHDGDEFVYRISGDGTPDTLVVQRISAPGDGGTVFATLGKQGPGEGVVVASELRDDGTTLWVVREEMRAMDLALLYAQPLPYLKVPLRTGVTESRSPVTLQRLSTGEVVAKGQALQRVSVTRAPAEAGPEVLAIGVERHLDIGDKTVQTRSGSWLKPGIGTVLSQNASEAGPITRQQLVCARIQGKEIGNCTPAGEEAR
jgi:hypothetical protein